jgi:hypothetical protein
MNVRVLRTAIAASLAVVVSSAAFADPPARVARVSFVAGVVSFRPASVDEWATATLNYPVTIGDHIWTDNAGRTELEAGPLAARIGPLTEFSVLNLDDHVAQFRITQGALSVRLRALGPDDVVEVDTPNGAITLAQPGLYRVDVNDTGEATTVTVRHGEADVAAAAAFSVRDNESAVLGTNSTAPPAVSAALRMDDFEDWVLARDRQEETAQQSAYVSPDMIGTADLVQYGTWRTMPEYGPVWMPRVRAEWVPYRYGHWAWVEPWGWTWIDDAPWGFAPFHYGRWVMVPGGWAWVPGRAAARPVYAPALVAFVGGNGWSAGVSIAEPVAWFPLGPNEVFVPAYQVSPAYVRAINTPHVVVTDVTVVNVATVRYVNREVPGAVTAVSRDVFVGARPVGTVAIAVPRESVRAAVVVGSSVPIQPQRVGIVGAARVAAPPARVVTREVIVKRQPPPAAERAPLREETPRAPAAAAQAKPPAPAPTAPAAPRPSAQELAARHAQERAAIDSRQAAERAALQTKQQQEQQHAAAADRAHLREQHQAETKALQDRHKQERDAMQKRQADERKPQ